MASVQSKITEKVLRLFNFKSKLNKALKKRLFRHNKTIPKKKLYNHYDIITYQQDKHDVFVLKPKQTNKNIVVLYLHGGAYLHGFQKLHWRFITTLIDQTDAVIVAPDYPLIPASVKETYQMLIPLYKDILTTYPHYRIIVMGDSAGGGLSLGLIQELQNISIRLPQHAILLSPWLDVTCQHPFIDELDQKDPILNKEALIQAGKLYAKDSSLKDPKLSPLYGNLSNLCPISIFSGSHDMLYSDTLLLIEKSLKERIELSPYLYDNMLHVWMFFGFPESKKVVKEIVDIIQNS
ncbi:MAG: alpha/beta hydrolase [Candidatus Izimaplasma sp.]|nr:alpha/beta hydrolase [Candidatus Izimaplasma bacterium]